MNRRDVLGSLACAGTVSLAGCSALSAVGLGGCGPGDTVIEDIENNSGNEVSVQGTVVEQGDRPYVFDIEDNTGKATIALAHGEAPSTDTCVAVTGTVSDCIGCDEDHYYIEGATFDEDQ